MLNAAVVGVLHSSLAPTELGKQWQTCPCSPLIAVGLEEAV